MRPKPVLHLHERGHETPPKEYTLVDETPASRHLREHGPIPRRATDLHAPPAAPGGGPGLTGSFAVDIALLAGAIFSVVIVVLLVL